MDNIICDSIKASSVSQPVLPGPKVLQNHLPSAPKIYKYIMNLMQIAPKN